MRAAYLCLDCTKSMQTNWCFICYSCVNFDRMGGYYPVTLKILSTFDDTVQPRLSRSIWSQCSSILAYWISEILRITEVPTSLA